ncbi:MAG: diacylglycerol kinase family lipid kinase [Anaerolineae bacterium]|nr:diacylglycerol kinase family lipid kinase [Anaerolineae bacterium]
MSRYKVIVNPVSGRGNGERAIPLIEQMLRGHGLHFDLVRTGHPWHAADLARQAVADGYDVVVAVGGDGTSNEVLNGLMWAQQERIGHAALGMLSVGRGNDFAYGMGVPRDLAAGCQVLAQGHRRTVDVGRATGGLYPQGRYFGNGVGIGFDAVVGFVALEMTRLSGFPSYIVATLKTVFLYYKAPLVCIEYDGQTLTMPALMVSIMNGRRLGGGFMMAPQAMVDDGLLDLCIAEQVSRARIFALIPHFMAGTQATQKPIRTGHTQRIVVTAVEGVLPAHADGETLCTEGQQLTVELLPRQIEVICQAPEAGL